MTIAKEEPKFKMTQKHQIIWDKLRSMEDGETIIGADLRILADIEDPRAFYSIIEDLRSQGLFVGASRHREFKGFYEIRTDKMMEHFLGVKRSELRREWKALNEFESKWIKEKYGVEEGNTHAIQ